MVHRDSFSRMVRFVFPNLTFVGRMNGVFVRSCRFLTGSVMNTTRLFVRSINELKTRSMIRHWTSSPPCEHLLKVARGYLILIVIISPHELASLTRRIHSAEVVLRCYAPGMVFSTIKS